MKLGVTAAAIFAVCAVTTAQASLCKKEMRNYSAQKGDERAASRLDLMRCLAQEAHYDIYDDFYEEEGGRFELYLDEPLRLHATNASPQPAAAQPARAYSAGSSCGGGVSYSSGSSARKSCPCHFSKPVAGSPGINKAQPFDVRVNLSMDAFKMMDPETMNGIGTYLNTELSATKDLIGAQRIIDRFDLAAPFLADPQPYGTFPAQATWQLPDTIWTEPTGTLVAAAIGDYAGTLDAAGNCTCWTGGGVVTGGGGTNPYKMESQWLTNGIAPFMNRMGLDDGAASVVIEWNTPDYQRAIDEIYQQKGSPWGASR